jgi:ring-1,2-phenylacetyl-CoA epoxidase subunit PaaE
VHRVGDAEGARVTVVRDGLSRELVFGERDLSILDAAARAGMDVPYSCKSGVCATCRAKVMEGKVRMDRNFALEPADVEAGFVLTCQAHPLTERVVVSFDER